MAIPIRKNLTPIKKDIPVLNEAKLNFRKTKDAQLVKGIFKFYEAPGAELTFNFKLYRGDSVQKYTLTDGKVYTLPLGVARHLNSGGYPEYEYIKGDPTTMGAADGTPMRIGKMTKRYGFQSLEFLDIEELGDSDQKQVVLVEKVPSPINPILTPK
jgi:hypothetical protein